MIFPPPPGRLAETGRNSCVDFSAGDGHRVFESDFFVCVRVHSVVPFARDNNI